MPSGWLWQEARVNVHSPSYRYLDLLELPAQYYAGSLACLQRRFLTSTTRRRSRQSQATSLRQALTQNCDAPRPQGCRHLVMFI